ncbi:MAG: hypothetical protein NC200_01705 [Candidatus Gastranaerophilales bacterium]|nr:hypothetical protein [Candidatus Gastranaerophilales bacterium]
MGLSSSQARLLNITARMHQIEYKAQKLEAMKLQMANESSKVYDDYLDALDATKIQLKAINQDGSLTYKDITQYSDLTAAGFRLYYVTEAGGVTTYNEFKEAQDNDTKQGKVNVPKLTSAILTNLLNSGIFVIANRATAGNVASNATGDTYRQFVDEELTSVSTNTALREVADETNLKKAEAKYEADMKRIDNKDRKYDTDLAALETERNALKQESETLKTVAKENVERTFKLFG